MSKALMAMCVTALFLVPVAAQAQRVDPQATFLFGLKLDKPVGNFGGESFFKSVGGLKSETEVTEYREGGENGATHKLPGRTKYSNIVLKRGFTGDMAFATWRKFIEDGFFQSARRNAVLVLYDKQFREIARWNLLNVWPSKISIGVEPDGQGNPVPTEEIEIAVEKVERG